jgi:acetyl esterase/lipase
MKRDNRIFDLKYGEDSSQKGNLYIPNGNIKGTICLLHGGFWKMPYDLHQFDQICETLLIEGFIVWNIEYRRTGVPERKWLDPFEDAVKSINYLTELKKTYHPIDVNNVIIMGHSAGGHLAMWLGNKNENITKEKLIIEPKCILGLAPILDLVESYNNKAGENAAQQLLQCTPSENITRYMNASPKELLPLKKRTIILHGDKDEYLPIETTRKYSIISNSYNNNLTLFEIKEGTHMDFIDPNSKATQKVLDLLKKLR